MIILSKLTKLTVLHCVCGTLHVSMHVRVCTMNEQFTEKRVLIVQN